MNFSKQYCLIEDKQKVDIYLSFEITRQCNMWCPYCYNIDVLTNTPDNNRVYQRKFLIVLEELLNLYPDKTIEVDLLGGEPTIALDLILFINKLEELQKKYFNLKWITITSNCLEIIPNLNQIYSNLRLSATYHNFIDIDLFLKNILIYKNYFQELTVTINLYNKKFDENNIMKLINFCIEHNIIICYIPVYDKTSTFTDIEIFSKTIQYFLKMLPESSRNVFFNSQNKFKTNQYKCRISSLNILFDGTISSSCGYKLPKLNILKDKLPINKILTCTDNICEGGAGYSQRLRSKDLNE
jgi:organic radical activating enzyme